MSFELGGVVQSDLKRLLVLQDTDRVVMGAEEGLRALEPEIAELDSVVEQLEDYLRGRNTSRRFRLVAAPFA